MGKVAHPTVLLSGKQVRRFLRYDVGEKDIIVVQKSTPKAFSKRMGFGAKNYSTDKGKHFESRI